MRKPKQVMDSVLLGRVSGTGNNQLASPVTRSTWVFRRLFVFRASAIHPDLQCISSLDILQSSSACLQHRWRYMPT